MEHFPWVFAVWIGVIILFNIVSAVRKVQKASAIKPQDLPSMPVAGTSAPAPVPVHEQAFAELAPEPVVVTAPVVIKRAKPPQAAKKQALPDHLVPDPDHAFRAPKLPRDGTKPLRGMFDRENLARAFIAAQVFGKPKALQEQSIWSPPHNDQSI
jgi:hypothetical protein